MITNILFLRLGQNLSVNNDRIFPPNDWVIDNVNPTHPIYFVEYDYFSKI